MGTRGLKVYRFRKRYYIFYNQYDSYPEGLGKTLVQEIPADPEEYKEWLATKRQEAAKWEEQWTTYACVDSVTFFGDKSDGQEPSTHPNDPESSAGSSSAITVVVPLEKVEANAEPVESAGVFCRCDRPKTQSLEADTLSDFMRQQSPAYFTPMNDIWIEWVYTIDLDLETFSVSNSAHFKLNLLPRDTWIDSLATGQQDDQIVLPGLVPPGAATSLAIDVAEKLTEQFEKLHMDQGDDATNDREIVNPKGLDDIPWARRHEASLRGLFFAVFTTSLQDMLAASLLQWSAEDLPFRELAFAILCLAAGGRNLSLIAEDPSNFRPLARSNTIISKKANAKEFIAPLATDFHLRGNPLGSSPEATVYWFEGALV
ncbi:MAG: hypothetical protein Q9214_007499, partial [Letrouitia sp. 1 TL-2023]